MGKGKGKGRAAATNDSDDALLNAAIAENAAVLENQSMESKKKKQKIGPTEQKTLERAARLEKMAALPEHLRLGVTLPGMRQLLSQLPTDAVEQVNANIPRGPSWGVGWFTWKGKPKFPENVAANGYVNQYFVALW